MTLIGTMGQPRSPGVPEASASKAPNAATKAAEPMSSVESFIVCFVLGAVLVFHVDLYFVT